MEIAGIRIDNLDMEETIQRIEEFIKSKKPHIICTANIDHIVLTQNDKEFKEIYQKADLVTADGMPLIFLSRLLGEPIKERVTGADLLPSFCEKAREGRYKIFLLGAEEQASKKAVQNLREKYLGINIVGRYSPPFGSLESKGENEKIIDIIKSKKPDILFVAFGAPTQEKWIYRNMNKINVPVSIGCGATIDFISGNVKRAPRWMQKIGLEWFHRFLLNPKKMYKRILRDTKFILRHILRKKGNQLMD